MLSEHVFRQIGWRAGPEDLVWLATERGWPKEKVDELREALEEREKVSDDSLYWLSFADGKLPNGSQFLGGAFVRAKTMAEALRDAHRDGINPGGEVQSIHCPDGNDPTGKRIEDSDIGRLMQRDECEKM